MKTKVTVLGTAEQQTKEIEGLITAAFWVGVEHAEDEVRSVRIRQDVSSYHSEAEELQEFVSILVRREIDFSIEFFGRPPQEEAISVGPRIPNSAATRSQSRGSDRDAGYRAELMQLRRALESGRLTKDQYEENRGVLLSSWRERVAGKMVGR